ncbi:uncharacterized protein LOC121985192 isoform X1 [Zingiber officinale]|uniref:uncharacterized protein LOC121985192 isoform X1 n=1 Tax=Zingiber officinale TaxID=94328 RepID=UPI001C4B228E|nr:uncharacterized protein LOC121985192 isoform X1 [Zingiber officinale]XP_042394424.1 uncharacterized protein LOC121985192 isoform X1 [Zingiber officinale]
MPQEILECPALSTIFMTRTMRARSILARSMLASMFSWPNKVYGSLFWRSEESTCGRECPQPEPEMPWSRLLPDKRFPNISEARTGIQELLAARAVGAIAENVKHISLKELLKSLEAELAEVGFSDASRDVGVSFSNICPNTTTGLSFKSFDINKVLEFGSPLLASDGQVMVLYLSRNLLKPKCYLASTLLYL